MNKRPIITIDGPAGAGKSTISRLLAARLGFIYLDTGALYRAVAYQAQVSGWDGSEATVMNAVNSARFCLHRDGQRLVVVVSGQDVSARIRTEEIGLAASRISAFPQVRESLLSLQREAGREGGVVAEGRDMGSVVFPWAEVKFYLDASPAERARRRCLEMGAKGDRADFAEIEKDMRLRDEQDRGRAVAPLKVPPDAVVVDSSEMTIPEVVEQMVAIIGRKRPQNGPSQK